MAINNVDAAIAAASQMINNPQFNALVESKAGNAKKSGGVSTDIAAMEKQAFGYSASDCSSKRILNETTATSNNGIPTAIQESFNKMPTPFPQQTYSMAQPAVQPTSQQIDYNYIKYLISEAIKENVRILNESKSGNLAGVRIAGGNKIQLMDTKGNLYEGVLTLKKKAEKK